MLADIAALVGRPPPQVKLPRAPLYPLAVAAEAVAQITGREPFLTLDGLRMAKKKCSSPRRKPSANWPISIVRTTRRSRTRSIGSDRPGC
jgi:hypothetical protein